MKIAEYENLEDKSKVYAHADLGLKVNTHLLIEHLESMADEAQFVFRGVYEAKFKLYNSAQRHWLGHELYYQSLANGHQYYQDCYNSFVNNLIEATRLWNGGTMEELFSRMGISIDNSLAYLSFMQHYGIPTPLLDFTTDPFIALFFAIDGVKYVPSSREIDNFFSVYCINTSNPMVAMWKKQFDGDDEKVIDLSYMKVVSNPIPVNVLNAEDAHYQVINNVNIINQKGLFIYNSDAFQPLGEVFYDFFSAFNQSLGISTEMKNDELFCMCFNIHKSLIPELSEVLKAKGITYDRMFPDLHKIRNVVPNHATRKLISVKNAHYVRVDNE